MTNSLRYPPVDRDDVVEVRHGVEVADPYRYLEDPDAERTRAFVDAQNAVSGPYLAALPARPALLALTTALLTAPRRGVPWERGGRYFVVANPGELDQDQLLCADSLDELMTAPTLLLDPNRLSADGTVAMTAARVSPDGTLLGLRAVRGGVGLADHPGPRGRVAAGDPPDELRWTKWVDPTWLPDASGSCTGATRRRSGGSSPRRWAPASCCCTGSARIRPSTRWSGRRPTATGWPIRGSRRTAAGWC